jgi:hypothetical protein
MRAIRLPDGTAAIFRSASKKPGTFGYDTWHGGWRANLAELAEADGLELPTLSP